MMLATLGWTVVHSLWQWTVIAGVVAFLLGLLHRHRAAARYVVACTGLVTMVAVSVVTFAAADSLARHDARMAMLYAFDGALIIPGIVPAGATILRIAAWLWLAGVALIAVYHVRACRHVRQLRRSPASPLPPAIEDGFGALCGALGVSGVELRATAQVPVPLVLGWRRPLILVPATLPATLSASECRVVLAHELEHVRRRDYLVNLCQTAIEALAFHHPAVHWISRQVRREREYCCDDLGARVAGDAALYARTLAKLEDARASADLAVAATSGTLLDRIQRLVQQPRRVLTTRRGTLLLLGALLVSIALLVITMNVPGPSTPPGVRMRMPRPGGSPSLVPQGLGRGKTRRPSSGDVGGQPRGPGQQRADR
jgi:beta-lactamase regulating signal transducer with metallopeptidase domain